jgi:hypothetical protein
VLLDGGEVLRAAAGECGGGPLIDVAALAPVAALGVSFPAPGRATLLTRDGVAWTVEQGSYVLSGDGRVVELPCPARVEGSSVLVAAEALARALGWTAQVDREARVVRLEANPVSTRLPGGWETFTVPKTPTELAKPLEGGAVSEAEPPPAALLPPTTSPLAIALAAGYVQHADFGAELSADGIIGGWRSNLGAFVTYGERGLRYQSAHLGLISPTGAWGLEAGDLFSEVAGLARGFRISLLDSKVHQPQLSLYAQWPGNNEVVSAAGLGEKWTLAPGVQVGGEVVSTGSYLVKTQLDQGRFHLNLFYRDRNAEDLGDSRGGFASFDLGRGVSASAGATRTHDTTGQTDWRTLAVRVPLGRSVSLTLEKTRTETQSRSDDIDAAMVSFPIGPVRILTRYQWRTSERSVSSGALALEETRQQDLMAAVTYFSSSRVSFDYQSATHWREDGSPQRWNQMVATWRVTGRTRIQVTAAVPHILEPDQLRVALVHDLRKDLSLLLDYGLLTPYQGLGIEPGQRGIKLMVRKLWTVQAPAGGGEVWGRVTDQAGQPVPQVLVGLGAWRALTDADGVYRFRHLPTGEYPLAPDVTSLPASYAEEPGTQIVRVTPGAQTRVNLVLVPYGGIKGRVCLEVAGEATEERCGEVVAVVRLDGRLTATGRDGRFTFANVTPGRYVVTLETKLLGPGLEPVSPTEVEVIIGGAETAPPVVFRLRERPKEIVWQKP